MAGCFKSSWSSLSADILSLIMECLYYVDQIHFRAVCKSWRSIYAVKHADKFPWVMSFYGDQNNSLCFLYDPSQKRKYTVKCEENEVFVGADVRASKLGWVLFSKIRSPFSTLLFFYSPFTNEIMKLPKLEHVHKSSIAVTFSTSPTSSDCVIFVLSIYPEGIFIYTCNPNGITWTRFSFAGSYGEVEDVAYVDGIFYCAFSRGDMGAFKVALQEWEVYTYQKRAPKLNLFEFAGNLLSLFCQFDPDLQGFVWSIYMFDQLNMEWFRVQSLGSTSIFIGRSMPILVPVERTCEFANTIHWDSIMHKIFSFFGSTSYDSRLYGWIEGDKLSKIWIQPPQLGVR